MGAVLIGLDFGSESARGVRIDVGRGTVEASHTHPYRHGVIAGRLPATGATLPAGTVLQDPADYLEAAEAVLSALGRGREVAAIGIDFTASSPLPALADGTPLSARHPGEPHAYVKLWKHGRAQPWADRITAAGGAVLDSVGGHLSGNSLVAKAAELAEDAPALWAEAAQFVEAGDWLVWRLTGQQARSLSFAGFKALFRPGQGYPRGLVEGLDTRLADPVPVGTAAGGLSEDWRRATGIGGAATVGVAVIDGHVVVPAVGAVEPGTLVGALGTSACFLLLDDAERAVPPGVEGVAPDATLPGLRCFEAGQAAFGDALAWFARAVPRGNTLEDSLAAHTAAAMAVDATELRVLALDWWNGCRVPYGDARLRGAFVGLGLDTPPSHLFRALMEALCFGTRAVIEALAGSGAPVGRVVLTSGLSLHSPALMQLMADVLDREVEVPQEPHLTAVGAAIHGAVAGGVVGDFAEGAARFGARTWRRYHPRADQTSPCAQRYALYGRLGGDAALRAVMIDLGAGAA